MLNKMFPVRTGFEYFIIYLSYRPSQLLALQHLKGKLNTVSGYKKKSFPHILHCAPRTLFNACRHTPNFWHHHTPFIIHFCATLTLLRVPLCISSDIKCLLHHLPMNNQEIKASSAPCGTQAEEKNRGGGKDGRTSDD